MMQKTFTEEQQKTFTEEQDFFTTIFATKHFSCVESMRYRPKCHLAVVSFNLHQGQQAVPSHSHVGLMALNEDTVSVTSSSVTFETTLR